MIFMQYLLVTHTLIWFFTNSIMIPNHIYEILESQDNNIYLSAISFLEITFKEAKNRLFIGMSIRALYEKAILKRFGLIPVEIDHLTIYKTIPFIHKDPYDRLLIAIAKSRDMTIITCDENIHKYDVKSIW